MPRFWTAFVAVALVSLVACGQETPGNALPAPPGYKTTLQQASYGIGRNIGHGIRDDELEIDVEAMIQGIRDVLADAAPRLTEDQIGAALKTYGEQMQAKAAAANDKRLRDGRAFLAANKNKPGVVTLPSGLQYTVIKKGNGPLPKLTDTVRTHYHGTFIDGTVFDSSVEKQMPATFQVGGVIRGWTEAIQMMQVGSKWRLFVPSELAYGPRGREGIAPNMVLIFEVELLGIE